MLALQHVLVLIPGARGLTGRFQLMLPVCLQPVVLVAPGSGPLHLPPGVSDAHQFGEIPSVNHL